MVFLRSRPFLCTALLLFLSGRSALAQEVEIPVLVLGGQEAGPVEDSSQLDMANMVLGAAKRLTTVAETPMIVSVITSDKLKAFRDRTAIDMLESVPGFGRVDINGGLHTAVLARGSSFSLLLLRDGVPMNDDEAGYQILAPGPPLEALKRIEVVTGPGGVLWGANAFNGQLNLITKDAEDVDGVEASVILGAMPSSVRSFVMAGVPKIISPKVKLFVYGGYERYATSQVTAPVTMMAALPPYPRGPISYGAAVKSDVGTSEHFDFDGRLTLGSVDVSWSWPTNFRRNPRDLNGSPVRTKLPEDSLPECSPIDWQDPAADSATDACIDRGRINRDNRLEHHDRVVLASWKRRLWGVSSDVKTYFVENVRNLNTLYGAPPIKNINEGGASSYRLSSSRRVGATVDEDITLGRWFKLLAGGEAFHDWIPDKWGGDPMFEAGAKSMIYAYNPAKLPYLCPLSADWDASTMNVTNATLIAGCPTTAVLASSRSVLAAYASGQLRIGSRFVIDAGGRLQASPAALGKRSYDPVVLGSATALYRLAGAWHVKLNVAQGFRPPNLYQSDANPFAANYYGGSTLEVERSVAYQGEILTRTLRNRGNIRELDLRADYAYSRLSNLTTINNGRYLSQGTRGINSVEFEGTLRLRGGHAIALGYAYERLAGDTGVLKDRLAHSLILSTEIAIVRDRLNLVGRLRMWGASTNPNRRIDANDLVLGEDGYTSIGDSSQARTVTATELVVDRQPPMETLQLGLEYASRSGRLTGGVMAYNLLDSIRYIPNGAGDFDEYNSHYYITGDQLRVMGFAGYRF